MQKIDIILVAESDYYPHQKGALPPDSPFTPLYDYLRKPLEELGLPLQYQLLNPQRQTLAALAAFLKNKGFRAATADNILRSGTQWERFKALLRSRPPAAGISTSCLYSVSNIRKITQCIREISPRTKIILGGTGAIEVAQMRGLADVTVAGQGELPLSRLLAAITGGRDFSAIPNLIITGKNGEETKSEQESVDILDTLPYPDWDSTTERPSSCFSVEASRGCRHDCVFCGCPGKKSQQYRPVEHILGEIRQDTEKYGAKLIQFIDANLTSDAEFMRRLCSEMIRSGIRIPWSCFARADELAKDGKLCRLMAEAGCFWVYLGIESGDDVLLRKMRKGFSCGDIHRGVENAARAGIMVHGNFITGFPGETPLTMKRTMALIRNSGLDSISFTVLGITRDICEHLAENPGTLGGLRLEGPRWTHSTMDFPAATEAARAMISEVTLTMEKPLIVAHGIATYHLLGGGLTLGETMDYFKAVRGYHRACATNDNPGKLSILKTLDALYRRSAAPYKYHSSSEPAPTGR